MAKIDDVELQKLLDKGLNKAQVAKHFGVSKSAVTQKIQKLRGVKTKVTVIEKAGQVVDNQLNAAEQLKKINGYANQLLDSLMEAINEYGQADKAGKAKALVIQLMREIRGQLELQLNILKSLYEVEAFKEFREEVIEILGSVDPELRERILKRLRDRQAIRRRTLPC